MPDLAGAYADTRRSMMDLARALTDDQLSARVPACPGWTVQELIAHVTSIASALANGEFPASLDPVASLADPDQAKERDRFVDDAIEARRDRSLDESLEEWETAATALEAMIRGERAWPSGTPPLAEWVVTTDLAVHHHDLRGALARPGERDSLATGLSLRSYVEGMRFRSAAMGFPTFRIRAGAREWTIGEGEAVATVTADPFELARAASGRRSSDQIRAYDWEGDPQPFLPLFYPYGVRADALVE
jgi:uncharacterized protein (TIGR03083 family)